MTVTRNEILTALNTPDAYILAAVEIANGFVIEPRYVRAPFRVRAGSRCDRRDLSASGSACTGGNAVIGCEQGRPPAMRGRRSWPREV